MGLIKRGPGEVSSRVIGCAIEVHKTLGPGLLESIYEAALCIELAAAGMAFHRQVARPVYYKGHLLGKHKPDLVVRGELVVEVKSIERLAPIHTGQMLTYLKVTGLHEGLILNFNAPLMIMGIKSVFL